MKRIVINLFFGLLVVIMVCDILEKPRIYSQMENRMLAEKPEWDWEEVLNQNYKKKYEEYLSDQFLQRDAWVKLYTMSEVCLQKKEVNGVYLGKKNMLFEVHLPEEFSKEQKKEKLDILSGFVTHCKQHYPQIDTCVMIIPTADNIYSERLPMYAPYWKQADFLQQVKECVGKDCYVDVESVLLEHKEEELYYKYDHHWNTLGAYYGYKAYMGIAPEIEEYTKETVSTSFQGTLLKKSMLAGKKEDIFRMDLRDYSSELEKTLYAQNQLAGKNQYAYFLNDNQPLVVIKTDVRNGKKLLLLKDSFANCFVPFLVNDFEEIHVIDSRYYNKSLYTYLEAHEFDSILILYNTIQFMKDFRIPK